MQDFAMKNWALIRKMCYIKNMKRMVYLLLSFLAGISLTLSSCGTIQIVPKDQPAKEQVQKEKTSPEKAPPPEVARKESPPEKGFLDKILQKISPQDTFARTYPFDFGLFYPKANSALQDYARGKKGNSFQISRIGSDAVILRGVYLREGTQERYVSTLTIKPAGSQKSLLEIKFDSSGGDASSGNPGDAAKEIFQIIEKAAGAPAR